ncbi:MAG: peptidase M64 [Acidobacteria bacterium]|nr:MAG: peptidase M64 [Acidobacteriota bacterium]
MTTRIVVLMLVWHAGAAGVAAAPATFRVDYYHTGNDKEEIFSLDRIVVEPLPWAGNPAQPIDATNRGKYFFEVSDVASGRVIYSRGFSSIYGEWESTAEAKTLNRTFSESLRFPAPDGPVRIVVKKRDAKNVFRDQWTVTIDPADKFVERGVRPRDAGALIKVHESGDPAQKLDLLILSDGYTAAERGKFERDARRLAAVLLATSPFKERERDINVWGLCPAAAESGVSRPSQRIYRRPPAGATYDAFDSERYVLTFENKAFRDLVANAPYDVVEILVNSATYGGGGIFGLYSTVAADSVWAPYIFVHEFGHHIAALADEYYTSDVAYLPAADRVEPWEPNVTALLDPAVLKWRDLVRPGTPLPTLWPKDEFEQYTKDVQQKRREIRAQNRPERDMDALFREEQKRDTTVLNTGALAGVVGAFEGANYEARGFYRPQADCIMFTRDEVPFCAVCRRAIETILDLYSR